MLALIAVRSASETLFGSSSTLGGIDHKNRLINAVQEVRPTQQRFSSYYTIKYTYIQDTMQSRVNMLLLTMRQFLLM